MGIFYGKLTNTFRISECPKNGGGPQFAIFVPGTWWHTGMMINDMILGQPYLDNLAKNNGFIWRWLYRIVTLLTWDNLDNLDNWWPKHRILWLGNGMEWFVGDWNGIPWSPLHGSCQHRKCLYMQCIPRIAWPATCWNMTQILVLGRGSFYVFVPSTRISVNRSTARSLSGFHLKKIYNKLVSPTKIPVVPQHGTAFSPRTSPSGWWYTYPSE